MKFIVKVYTLAAYLFGVIGSKTLWSLDQHQPKRISARESDGLNELRKYIYFSTIKNSQGLRCAFNLETNGA